MTRPLVLGLSLLVLGLACGGLGNATHPRDDSPVDGTTPDAQPTLIPAAIAMTIPAEGAQAATPVAAGPWLAFDGDPSTGFTDPAVGPQVMLAGDSHITGVTLLAGHSGVVTIKALNTEDYSEYAETFKAEAGKERLLKLDFRHVKSLEIVAPGVALNELQVHGQGPTPAPTAQVWSRPMYAFAATHPVVAPHEQSAQFELILGTIPSVRLPSPQGGVLTSAEGDTVTANDTEVILTRADGTSTSWTLQRITPCQWVVGNYSLVAKGCLPSP